MVAELADSVVAFMIYELHRSRLHMLNFAVTRSHRRLGVGTQMMEKLVAKLTPDRRGESLTLDELARLARALQSLTPGGARP
jgi:ribosomal-protein-alanine N-acetyltransferase